MNDMELYLKPQWDEYHQNTLAELQGAEEEIKRLKTVLRAIAFQDSRRNPAPEKCSFCGQGHDDHKRDCPARLADKALHPSRKWYGNTKLVDDKGDTWYIREQALNGVDWAAMGLINGVTTLWVVTEEEIEKYKV